MEAQDSSKVLDKVRVLNGVLLKVEFFPAPLVATPLAVHGKTRFRKTALGPAYVNYKVS